MGWYVDQIGWGGCTQPGASPPPFASELWQPVDFADALTVPGNSFTGYFGQSLALKSDNSGIRYVWNEAHWPGFSEASGYSWAVRIGDAPTGQTFISNNYTVVPDYTILELFGSVGSMFTVCGTCLQVDETNPSRMLLVMDIAWNEAIVTANWSANVLTPPAGPGVHILESSDDGATWDLLSTVYDFSGLVVGAGTISTDKASPGHIYFHDASNWEMISAFPVNVPFNPTWIDTVVTADGGANWTFPNPATMDGELTGLSRQSDIFGTHRHMVAATFASGTHLYYDDGSQTWPIYQTIPAFGNNSEMRTQFMNVDDEKWRLFCNVRDDGIGGLDQFAVFETTDVDPDLEAITGPLWTLTGFADPGRLFGGEHIQPVGDGWFAWMLNYRLIGLTC